MINGVVILKQEERSVLDETTRRQVYLRTMWKYAAHGPYYDDAPKEGWTAAAFESRIMPHIAQLQALGL